MSIVKVIIYDYYIYLWLLYIEKKNSRFDNLESSRNFYILWMYAKEKVVFLLHLLL